MANPPIGQKSLITAEQFNELLSNYSTYWADDLPDNLSYSELDNFSKDEHSKGWGQPPVEPIPGSGNQPASVSGYIYGHQTNKLISQLNAGVLHTQLPTYADRYIGHYEPGTIITTSGAQALQLKIAELGIDRFNLNPSNALFNMDITNGAVDDTTSDDWKLSAVSVTRATFASYNEARYFFNSGGRVAFDISGVGRSTRGSQWANALELFGEIAVGALDTTNTGPQSPMFSKGIYDAIGGNNTEIFAIKVDRGGNGEYGFGEYGEYTDYGGGEYDSASVKIKVQCTEVTPGGTFYCDFYIILDEDQNIDNVVMMDLTVTMGYQQPLDAPIGVPSGSLASKFSGDAYVLDPATRQPIDPPVTYTFKFAERTPPTLSIVNTWTVIN